MKKTAADFKADVIAAIEPTNATEGRGRPNLKGLLRRLDEALEEFGPTISSLAPVQYRAVLALVVKLVDVADDRINGAD